MAVEFYEMDDGSAYWAILKIKRLGMQRAERIWARRHGLSIHFGRAYDEYGEGGQFPPPLEDAERRIPIRILQRVLEAHDRDVRTELGHFTDWREKTVTYVTTCGERRTVRLVDLRAVVDDALGLPEGVTT